MAFNTITLEVDDCQPEPVNGWRVIYRPTSGGAYREVPGRFSTSPIVFTTNLDPAGTQYEGFIQGDCGDGQFGVPVPWSTDDTAPSLSPDESPSASPAPPCNEWFNPGPGNATGITYRDCNGVVIEDIELTSGSNICAQEIISGPAEGELIDNGPC